MEFIIKKVKPKDSLVVTNIIHQALKQDFPYKKGTIAGYLKVYDKKYFIDVIKRKKNIILGSYKDRELVGLIVLKIEFGGVVFVDWLVVKREYRGKGIGSALLEKADEWALSNKCHYLYLCTETSKNIDFYEKRGFNYVGKHTNSWFGETEHVLGKSLRSKPFPESFKINPPHSS